MKKIQLFGLLSLLAFTVVSSSQIAEAAYYGYVNESGNVVYVEANTVTGAFTNSTNIADTSGVILTNSTGMNTGTNGNTNGTYADGYLYVNEFGTVIFVDANTANGAFTNSINIADTSGVLRIDTVSESNLEGNKVSGI